MAIITSNRYCNKTYHFCTLIKQLFKNKLIFSVLFVTETRNSSVYTLLKILIILPSKMRITFMKKKWSWFWLLSYNTLTLILKLKNVRINIEQLLWMYRLLHFHLLYFIICRKKNAIVYINGIRKEKKIPWEMINIFIKYPCIAIASFNRVYRNIYNIMFEAMLNMSY